MRITGTHFNYFMVCKRKLWLFANGINMEHTSDLVYEGKMLHEDSYPRRPGEYEEIEMDGIKIDFYDPKTKTIHEIKKSDKIENAHIWQLKYYLYVFYKNGIEKTSGILEYPALRKKETVLLENNDIETIHELERQITEILKQETCPCGERKGLCTNCSYYEFCYAAEPDMESVK